jgi:hypothetical protein
MNNKDKQRKYVKYLYSDGPVLELGSGGGDFLDICAGAGLKAEGVDSNKNSASVKKFKASNADMRVFLKKKKAGIYGSVYARHVIEHFFPADLKELMAKIYKILKMNGAFIMIFPNVRNLNVVMHEFWKDETHARPYAKEAVIKMLEETGFKIAENGADKDSWDNSFIKNLLRILRSLITGIPAEPPDYFNVAKK